MSLLSIYSGSACAWIISEINRDTMGELQVVIPKAASTLLYPMVRPLTVRLGSLLLRIYSAFSFVLFSALYFLKTANIQELNVLLFAEYLLLCGIAELSLWGVRGVQEKRIWRVWIVTILASVIPLGIVPCPVVRITLTRTNRLATMICMWLNLNMTVSNIR